MVQSIEFLQKYEGIHLDVMSPPMRDVSDRLFCILGNGAFYERAEISMDLWIGVWFLVFILYGLVGILWNRDIRNYKSYMKLVQRNFYEQCYR